ncbi:JAB domain-containing protein [Alteromonas sediminis]|uniref:JAB domain-containing protein n=1 Tax=Alteromonas sediminis TaxID=2259342 RepID=A0A3N5XY34_9ALTE|nr:DNA repair protein RadC [Alteromonas sediminis]RPJ65480.1 JAB domain-containing protein [Alteromonas sediminis]
MKMRDWPEAERPCEKLLRRGTDILSDAELLAVFIRSGQKQRDALMISHDLLKAFGSLRSVITARKEAFCAVAGVGEVRYAQIQAALEMVKRQYEETLMKESVFNNTVDVERYLRCHLRDMEHEVFGVLMLDSQHQLIKFRKLFTGTINASAVYPRDVVKCVLADNAAATILVHNHPSGVAEPSQADICMTKTIKKALDLIDVPLLDHFIVGDAKTVSLAQRGEI